MTMQFGLIDSMCDPAHYLPIARALEASGWATFYVPDSICYPEKALPGQYPYNEDGAREFLEGAPFLEPFSVVPAMAAMTRRLRFGTDVLKLPIRNPVILAKQVNTVAVMTGGRFSLGVGLSPWVEDFIVTQTDFATRAARFDEMIEILRGLMSGEYFGYQGKHYEFPRIKMCPVPSRPVPILVGGHARPALRRAARLGDGWISAGSDFDTLGKLLGELRGYLREFGRDPERFELHVMAPQEGYTLEGARRLRDLGVTSAIYSFRNPYVEPDISLRRKRDFVKRFTEEVIARL
jgi:probable F420-dependent oxidoreductase